MLDTVVNDLISYYAEFGDVQTAAYLVLVFDCNLSKKIVTIEKQRVVSILKHYLLLLKKLNLYLLSAEIIKFCQVWEISNMYKASTEVDRKC